MAYTHDYEEAAARDALLIQAAKDGKTPQVIEHLSKGANPSPDISRLKQNAHKWRSHSLAA